MIVLFTVVESASSQGLVNLRHSPDLPKLNTVDTDTNISNIVEVDLIKI